VSVSFTPLECGITVSDTVEQRQCQLATPEPVRLRDSDGNRFVFPVDNAVALETDEVTLSAGVAVYVRDAEGRMVEEVDRFESQTFDAGVYDVELCGPIKLYLRVHGPLSVESGFDSVTVSTAGETVHAGARSHHKHPEATITTTGDPEDLMQAVSAFGSALKTTSPERSFPTLRGHPPELRLGDELDVPAELTTPDTGVRLELLPTREHVFPAVSPAYYLGATLEPGAEARLVTETGFEHDLGSGREYERELERVLKRTFFMDCLVRTEGYYEVDLHERAELAEVLEGTYDLDFAALYDAGLAERLAAYLRVPFEAVEDQIPEWKLTSHVDPTAENAELLPFLVDDLAIVRRPRGQTVSASPAQTAAISEFTRDFTRSTASADGGTRSVAAGADSPDLIEPEGADSLEQAWAGADAPIGASKVSVEAFRNRLARDETDGDIDITVVCNDDRMDEEQDLAAAVYGSREELPFDVRVYHNLSVAALRAVVETDSDFLHYIGHIDDDGLVCSDGKLDVRDLESDAVGVDAFFLNACTSYEQGMALIERGAIGGVVTLSDVLNSGAVNVGKTMIRLLNQGFPLRAALEIASDRSIVGGQYIVVGDGNADISQPISIAPVLAEVESDGSNYDLTIHMHYTLSHGVGTLVQPFGLDEEQHYLCSRDLQRYVVTGSELETFLGSQNMPVLFDGELRWSSELLNEDL
jgi:hypothetical protein